MSSTEMSVDPVRALDGELRMLMTNEVQRAKIPLSLRRFSERFNTSRPTEAMRLAADNVLKLYTSRGGRPRLPISIQQLCGICDVELNGLQPAARSGTTYSVYDDSRRKSHTGKTYFLGCHPLIKIPPHVDFATARVSVAHELAHVLVHARDGGFDEATVRLPSTPEEEALAEYGARLLLMPTALWPDVVARSNFAERAVVRSNAARVTIHSAVLRLGDPDVQDLGMRGAILWRMNPQIPRTALLCERLTPQWHMCPGQFIPIKRCRARNGSLIAVVAEKCATVSGSQLEDVAIGSFVGSFVVHALAWGSVEDGTRLVLSVFQSSDPQRDSG